MLKLEGATLHTVSVHKPQGPAEELDLKPPPAPDSAEDQPPPSVSVFSRQVRH